MYLLARSWGISPTDFWDMTLPEWFCEWRQHEPRSADTHYAGSLTRGDVDELLELLENAR